MKGKQLQKKLRKLGVTFEKGRGKGGHILAIYGDKQTTVPSHGDSDFSPQFVKLICKQLGINPEDL